MSFDVFKELSLLPIPTVGMVVLLLVLKDRAFAGAVELTEALLAKIQGIIPQQPSR